MSKKKTPFFPAPALPCTGVETHAHLNSKQFAEDLEAVLQRAAAAGVAQLMQVFLHPTVYEAQKHLFAPHSNVYYLLGIHPTEADQYTPEAEAATARLMREEPRFRAIGEIGLDYYWKDQPADLQKQVFAAQLALAKACDMPVVIHCRDAEEDTLAMLLEHGFSGRPLLWHCFGGTAAFAQRVVEHGWHLSIPGPVTYPANTHLREAVAAIPLERLMVETDCPYLAPVPLRGQRNEPAYLGYTIQAMAEARGMDVAELWTTCGNNARRFFGLPELA
ncbi:TatD family hydrolase [Desulfovibrio cuneatus]|uniref:TatD family hydrolase n=1 Tax=Desulfovibrio cuneatus TaxID=159728 RepID=UPI000426AA7D|nr:TatD family hydrolase [Desulfovibrio cuneatus]